MKQLNVYMNDCKAGVLTEKHPGKDYTFCYDNEYLSSEYPAISVTLPKQKEVYESEHLFPLFTNMLPEGANRKVICRFLRIDEKDFFGILTAMADKDFIGAVQIRRISDDRD
ncbi:HipA N-terminal domain-containing protein [Bacteroides acidifaciens]|uniref:HipA N-terminal domain-containing protein n=1 Tax=Bacteroides acidifaciens TaxID=85831 RepID=UPI00242CFF97|nr:HipA N-terminal domain-containing protein [Bacteroides acidifaciens]